MNMSCENARPLVPSYLDGEVGEELAKTLRQHLLACPSCREVAKDENVLKRWFAAPSAPSVPSDFSARVARLAFAGEVSEPPADLIPFRGGAPAPLEFGALDSADDSPTVAGDHSVRSFVVQLTGLAAAALLLLSLAIRYRTLPSSSELDASPRMSVEDILEAEREASALPVDELEVVEPAAADEDQ